MPPVTHIFEIVLAFRRIRKPRVGAHLPAVRQHEPGAAYFLG